MLYFKAPGTCIRQDFASSEWGEFVRYVEVADDQYATRQVEVYTSGQVLRYDRAHWCDDFGILLGYRFSRKPKWAVGFPGAEVIDPVDFERIWRGAQKSPQRGEQAARSRAAQWGEHPHWLRES
jgi:hypothetical protein